MFRSLLILMSVAFLSQVHAVPGEILRTKGDSIKADGTSGARCILLQSKTKDAGFQILTAMISVETGKSYGEIQKYLVARVFLEKSYDFITSARLNPAFPHMKTASVEQFQDFCGKWIYLGRPLGNSIEFFWPIDNSNSEVKLEHWVMGPDDLHIPQFHKMVQKYKDLYKVNGGTITAYGLKNFKVCSGEDFEECLATNIPKFKDSPAEELPEMITTVRTEISDTFVHKLQRESN